MAGIIAPITHELMDLVKNVSPLVGSALGTPLSGLVLNLLGNLFGADPKDTQSLIDKIKSDPEYILKLKQLEITHEETLIQIAATNYQTEVDDRKSAREREVAIRDWVPTILAVGFLINYATIQFYCVTHNNSVNDIISARFQDVLIMIISYYFGSSHKEIPRQ